MASKGIYNPTYFRNNPSETTVDAILYCVVLVNKKTFERECVKIGIAKGKDWRHVIKRSSGFSGFDIRTQKVVSGQLEDIYYLEQYLHELWGDYKHVTLHKFGGHTELFKIEKLSEIIDSIPDSV